jgi:hypothetical protein
MIPGKRVIRMGKLVIGRTGNGSPGKVQ